MKKCVWVRPEAVERIEYLEWTDGDHLRHSKFAGLREDKKARSIAKKLVGGSELSKHCRAALRSSEILRPRISKRTQIFQIPLRKAARQCRRQGWDQFSDDTTVISTRL
jgi:hypothetical protein